MEIEDYREEDGRDGLVAYRLGRVEKAVENFNDHAIIRDKEIIDKLTTMGEVNNSVIANSFRVSALESWKRNITNYLVAFSLIMATGLTTVFIKLLFHQHW